MLTAREWLAVITALLPTPTFQYRGCPNGHPPNFVATLQFATMLCRFASSQSPTNLQPPA